MKSLEVEDHPLLDLRAFVTVFPSALHELPTRENLLRFFSLNIEAPLGSSDEVRTAVRDLLRHDGFKPKGRSKPASEYLLKAAGEGMLSSINLAVDVCNAVSLHSGLPISVIDLEKVQDPLCIRVASPESAYVFNPSGQTIEVGNLLGLFDANGPCANAVKDSQRTKTGPETTQTLSLIWGTKQFPEQADAAEQWSRELLANYDAEVRPLYP